MKKGDRKAIYQYYRSIGYSVKQATNMRNRPEQVWRDHFKYLSGVRAERRELPKSKRSTILLPKPPKVSINKPAIKKQFQSLGLKPKMIRQIMKLSNQALMDKSLRMQTAMEKFVEFSSYSGFSEDYAALLADADNMVDFWKAVEEGYFRYNI